MARYKHTDLRQSKLIPVSFDDQIFPETFEHTLAYIIDEVLDLSVFDERYRNDETGRPAYDPAILLKVVLYAYSLGITSSRDIEYACRTNVVFMALSGDTRPHFTTIAGFVSRCGEEAIELFRDALLYCDELGLIGREMFAIDGVKLPSNASKEWSGTRADFEKKKRKMEKALRYYLKKHREQDRSGGSGGNRDREERHIETLRAKIKKIRGWLAENDDKPGKTGKPKKSNITDNESAKMMSAHGVIQGYDGVAVADAKHQVIVHAEAFGEAQEHDLLVPMMEGVRENFQAIGKEEDIFQQASVCADAGYHSEDNMAYLFEEEIDGYVADTLFRKRDPRFAGAGRHKPKKTEGAKERLYLPKDFIFDPASMSCICPAGKKLYRNGAKVVINAMQGVKFRGPKCACVPCTQRSRCLRHPERTETRQVVFFQGQAEGAKERYTQKMKRKIDTEEGRARYGLRLSTIEPVFGNIRSTLGLDRFTLRGKWKVNGQWLLFSLVHNIGKIHRYGYGYT